MKVRMYRNYDKFKSGGFNGRMIFTFFRPISRAFDCILVELPEGYKPLPLKKKVELKSNWHEKTYIGNPGDYVLNIDEKRYLILDVIAAEDTSPSSDHMFFHVQSFNSKDQETRLPAFGLPENTPPAIIEMIEKEATRRDELISSHGEEDWG